MDRATRMLRVITVRSVLPWSRTRKNSELPRLMRIANMTAMIRKSYIVCRAAFEAEVHRKWAYGVKEPMNNHSIESKAQSYVKNC